jgi:TM2 domain-containing membrane protein YozV
MKKMKKMKKIVISSMLCFLFEISGLAQHIRKTHQH